MYKLKTFITLILVIILLGINFFIFTESSDLLEPHLSEGTFSSNSYQPMVIINQTFGGPFLDYSYSLIATSDGGYVLVGYTYSYGAGESDLWLVKTNSVGQAEWNRTIGGLRGDFGFSIIKSSDGGYIIVGGTESFSAGSYDLWLVKTNITGQVEWESTIGGPGADYGFSVIESSEGGYILAGRTGSYGAGGEDAWLVKTDANGQVEWNHTFGGKSNDAANSVIATTDGGYVFAGGTESNGVDGMDIWLVKTNVNGQVEWNQTIGGNREDLANAIISTPDGGFVVTGFTQSYGAGGRDVWLIKTNGTGYSEWNHTFGGNGLDYADCIISTPDSGYMMAGRTESYGAGKSDMWVIKTTATGHLEWNHTFGGPNEEAAYSVIATSDGGYVLVGRTASYSIGQADTWLIKIILQDETSSSSRSVTGMPGFIVILTFVVLMIVQRKK